MTKTAKDKCEDIEVTIKIPCRYVESLSHYASISRTMDNALYIGNKAVVECGCQQVEDRVNILQDDIDSIRQPLDYIMKAIQQEIWSRHD